ncbi:AAA family ATPase [Candidatus Roizmanbacteria bacterium]|nr:AAA family ATPase [Candidatus Roizmanbacteria bacterium]
MTYTKIAISGKICSGKSTLFNDLQKKLKWPVFQTGKYFREYVAKKHMTLEDANEQNDKLTKEIDYMVRDRLHAKGHLIVDGWMSGIMANNIPDVLRILLVCDDGVRAARFSEREKVPLSEAQKRVKERLANWIDKLKKIYKRDDFFDEKNYNLIIDTSHITSKKVLQIVIDSLK